MELRMGPNRTIGSRGILAAGLGLAWVIGIVGAAGGSGMLAQTAASDKPLLSEQAFKNVQVLRGIPVDDFMGTMGVMCASLAFDCSDCHEAAGTQHVDWAADNPVKRTARRMVTMMLAINKQNFQGRQVVTCWTCHRNRDKPLVTPTMEVMYGEPPEQRDDVVLQAPGLPTTAVQVFDKFIAAVGGAERLAKLTSYVATGTGLGFGGFGGGAQVRIYARAPDKRSTIIEYKDDPDRGDSSRTYNGAAGWLKTPLTVLGEFALSGSELDGARLDAMLGFPGQIKTAFTNARVGFPSSIDDRAVQVVQADGPRGLMTTMYFDSETGLLLRMIRYGKSPIGRVPTQVDIADYREVPGMGVRLPFRWTFAWLDGRDSFQITNVQPNVPVEEMRFGRPSAAIKK